MLRYDVLSKCISLRSECLQVGSKLNFLPTFAKLCSRTNIYNSIRNPEKALFVIEDLKRCDFVSRMLKGNTHYDLKCRSY